MCESLHDSPASSRQIPLYQWTVLPFCSATIPDGRKSRRSVSRVLSTPPSLKRAGAGRPFLWDGCYHPPQATNPGGEPENLRVRILGRLIHALHCRASGAKCRTIRLQHTTPAAPIRSCSRWGLPCPLCYQRGGALLPHRFTLTLADQGGLFSVALSLGSPPPDVIRHRFSVEPGLSSSRILHLPAAVQPSGGCLLPARPRRVNQGPYRRRAPHCRPIFLTAQMLGQKMPLKRADDIRRRQAHIIADRR